MVHWVGIKLLYFAVAFYHFFIGVTHLFYPDRYRIDVLEEVFHYVPIWVWGAKGMFIFSAMLIGYYTQRFMLSRVALCIGLFFMLYRGLGVEVSGLGGAQVGAYLLLAALHYFLLTYPSDLGR